MKEYQFHVGNVWLDIYAQSAEEAVRFLNESLHCFNEPFKGPGRIERFFVEIADDVTEKDITKVYVPDQET